MKVTLSSSDSRFTQQQNKKENNKSFKGIGTGLLGLSGSIMQGIENKGYLMSFLIQDGLGMTLPRVATGFHRDKEQTGRYNMKEGIEVALREGLTGPFMISVAPLMLFLTGKYCKSAGNNTRLLKLIGNNLKEMVKSPDFDKALLNNKENFQREFYKYNLEKFYKDTVPNDKEKKETIEYLLKEFEKFNSKDKKVSKEAAANITSKINNKILESSTELDELYRLGMNINGKYKAFSTGDTIKAIRDYGNDAIYNNKHFSEIDEKAAENIKNNFATKRLAFNVGTIAATLGGLSVLPKIYAHSDVSPGAALLLEQKEALNTGKNKQTENIEQDVNFKGKGINSDGILSKIGKFLTKSLPDWIHNEFEYNGYNFTPTMMACLSMFGLLLPRGLRAYNRAYVDENGKRDWSEVHEILLRDLFSSLSVVYTVPILTKLIVNTYENKQGYVLTNRASMNKNKFQKFIDVINPYSDLKVLTNSELEALYNNIDSKKKMLNFAEYINKKGGDLEKILSKSDNVSQVFNDKTFTLSSIKKLSKADKNNKIISLIKDMKDGSETNELITKLMNDAGKGKQSKITHLARGLNSIPGAIVTLAISPIILGVFIPMLTYANTRRTHAKMLNEKSAQQETKIRA